MKPKNHYFLLRHGEALSNKRKIISSWPEKGHFPLTLEGRKKVKNTAEKLKEKKIDLIFSSDILRARQTAEIISKELKIKPEYDKRLREINVGIFNGEKIANFINFFSGRDRFIIRPPKGENYIDVQKRIVNFLLFLEKRYSGKNILIISHQVPFTLLEAKIRGISNKEFYKKMPADKRIKPGELRELIVK